MPSLVNLEFLKDLQQFPKAWVHGMKHQGPTIMATEGTQCAWYAILGDNYKTKHEKG